MPWVARFVSNPGVRASFNGSMESLLVMSLIPVFW